MQLKLQQDDTVSGVGAGLQGTTAVQKFGTDRQTERQDWVLSSSGTEKREGKTLKPKQTKIKGVREIMHNFKNLHVQYLSIWSF